MNKQELIHMHALFAEIGKFIGQDDTINIDAYNEMDITHKAIHRSKDDHQKAIHNLTDGITDELEGNESSGFEWVSQDIAVES